MAEDDDQFGDALAAGDFAAQALRVRDRAQRRMSLVAGLQGVEDRAVLQQVERRAGQAFQVRLGAGDVAPGDDDTPA